MSYRTFKHLLGETSLERKCRFIFGGGILILVTLSFYFYGQKTENLVLGQNTQAARMLVNPVVVNLHARYWVGSDFVPVMDALSSELAPEPQRSLSTYYPKVFNPYSAKSEVPSDTFETRVLRKFVEAAANRDRSADVGAQEGAMRFPNGQSLYEERIVQSKREYQYMQAVLFQPGCLVDCHQGSTTFNHMMREENGKFVPVRAGDLAGVVSITLPMDQTQKAINRNRAILITAALVTAILAMVASYVIVRYIVVKPLKHLQDVSNAIAAGVLHIRSQIQTGDEFEELSHAFNRMLHNLVAMQQALREVNGDLDRKVDELAQANLSLHELNRVKSDFLATVSHELRTPLNSIIGFSEILSEAPELQEKHRKFVANIQTSGRMLLSMINDILDMAKIESGRMTIHTEEFSIYDLIDVVRNQLRPMAEKKKIDFQAELAPNMPLLHQDQMKLRQVIFNLLSNAIKFTYDRGIVTLQVSCEGPVLVIRVVDNGMGIAAEDQEMIFEKFRQGRRASKESVLTREHEGTGLGLSIVREFCRLMGGEVSLESRLGEGSTFTVTLPIQHRDLEKSDQLSKSYVRQDIPRSDAKDTRALTSQAIKFGLTRP
ncbi:HAMP domain-containing protein [bacterium]|nr:HAMP domain-containing protein [bacterium]